MRILHHFSIPIPDSPYFTIIGAISTASVRRSEAELLPKWPRTKTIDPATPAVPSTFGLSSSGGGVTLKAIMGQLQRMDTHLDILSDELC